MKNIKTISAYVKTLEAYESWMQNRAIRDELDAKKSKSKKLAAAIDAAYDARCEVVYAIMDKFDVDMVEAGFIVNDVLYYIENEEAKEKEIEVVTSDIGMTVEEVEDKLSWKYHDVEFDGIDAEDGQPEFEDVEDFMYAVEEICPNKEDYLTLPLNGHMYRVCDVIVEDEDRVTTFCMEKVA